MRACVRVCFHPEQAGMDGCTWVQVHGHLAETWETEWCGEKKDEAVLRTCIVTPGQIGGILKAERDPESVL